MHVGVRNVEKKTIFSSQNFQNGTPKHFRGRDVTLAGEALATELVGNDRILVRFFAYILSVAFRKTYGTPTSSAADKRLAQRQKAKGAAFLELERYRKKAMMPMQRKMMPVTSETAVQLAALRGALHVETIEKQNFVSAPAIRNIDWCVHSCAIPPTSGIDSLCPTLVDGEQS